MFNLNHKEKGQGLVEYALILVLIAIVVIVAMQVTGQSVCGTFAKVINSFGDDYFVCEGVGAAYHWDDDIFTEEESCANMGAEPGTKIYVWTPLEPKYGDVFYHTSSDVSPKDGYKIMFEFECN